MFWAAWSEVEQDRERRTLRRRIGRDQGDRRRRRRPGDRPTARGRPARAGASRSRQTMKSQRCRFLELPDRRPARRIRSRCSGSQRAVGELADGALRVDRGPDRIGHRLAHVRVGSGDDRHLVPDRSRLRVAPGSATWASVRRPPGVSLDGRERAFAVGDPLGTASRPRSVRPASPGERPAAGRVARKLATAAAIAGILVQPGMLAALDEERLDRSAVDGSPARGASGPRPPGGPCGTAGRRRPPRRGPGGPARRSGRWPSSR